MSFAQSSLQIAFPTALPTALPTTTTLYNHLEVVLAVFLLLLGDFPVRGADFPVLAVREGDFPRPQIILLFLAKVLIRFLEDFLDLPINLQQPI